MILSCSHMHSVLAMDLGTTGNRTLALDGNGRVLAKAYRAFKQSFPKPGWVEHDPKAIWFTALQTLKDVLSASNSAKPLCMGLTNQRETVLLWDSQSGEPVYPAIVWQCRRTAGRCRELAGQANAIREKTGLPLDPYFSATKIAWILENVPGANEAARSGKLLAGTIDSWILWKLTGGKVHATEASNASRTMCFNLRELKYDSKLLDLFGIPEAIMPPVKDSGGEFGVTNGDVVGAEIPITGILGDQQAALFAQNTGDPSVVKTTYGTGLFLMASTGPEIVHTRNLVTTIAWKIANQTTYALEGSAFTGGASLQWLEEGLGILENARASLEMAEELKDNEGVYFVPALSGLGAPYWDPGARGLIIGLTRGTRRAHFARAALESIAYQVRDFVEEFRKEGVSMAGLRCDGGAAANDFLMQFQADILGLRVERPQQLEVTALGAAGIAGLTSGFWTREEFAQAVKMEREFIPELSESAREKLYGKWLEAVSRSRNWEPTG